MRQVFWASARRLDVQRADAEARSAKLHSDFAFKSGCKQLLFWWDPYLNNTRLLDLFHDPAKSTRRYNTTTPRRLLLGTGLWHARDMGEDHLNRFVQAIDRVTNITQAQNPRAKSSSQVPEFDGEDLDVVLMAPVPLPEQSKLESIKAKKLTPARVKRLNDHLAKVAARDNLEVLWSFAQMTSQRSSAFKEDGIHVVEQVADKQADIVLNIMCNKVGALQRYPFDKTCCVVQPPLDLMQRVLIYLALVTAIVAVFTWRPISRSLLSIDSFVDGKVARAAGTIAMALLYCFTADRTYLLDRVQKIPDKQAFLCMVTIALAGGLSTLEHSRHDVNGLYPEPGSRSILSTQLLSRSQTDEWKGWMQFVVLAYHYTGMSQVLWIYQLVRLLVAAYLFMTGYGHTIYFLRTNDFSTHRLAAVLIRLNLLSCALAYLMRTDYEFYYFPALSSFWFLTVYCTVRIGHRFNDVFRVFVLKVMASALVVCSFVHTPGILEHFHTSLSWICKMQVDVHETRFRLSLDQYVVYVGMLAAALTFQMTSERLSVRESLDGRFQEVKCSLRILSVVLAILILPIYAILAWSFQDKYEYNHWHSLISPVVILAFVVLRNASQGLRNVHSRLFAWLGRCSLETFVLQYHIWLAANTKDVLSLGLWSRSKYQGWIDDVARATDFAIVTIVFLWTSSMAAHATNLVTQTIVGRYETLKPEPFLPHARSRKDVADELATTKPSEFFATSIPECWMTTTDPSRTVGNGISYPSILPAQCTKQRLVLRLTVIVLLLWAGNQVSPTNSTSQRLS